MKNSNHLLAAFLLTVISAVIITCTDANSNSDSDSGSGSGSDSDTNTNSGSDVCADGCLIDTICYPNGVTNPTNTCEICHNSIANDGWSSNDGTTCDDGLFCTYGDICNTGICTGAALDCSDGIECTGDETCDEEADACILGTSTCVDPKMCDVTNDECVTICTGCVISGVCYGEGQTNPTNICQKCDTLISDVAWTDNDGATCDDDLFCTGADTCAAGVCTHAGDPCTGQNEDCVEDSSIFAEGSGCACSDGWTGELCHRCVIYVNGTVADDSKDGKSWTNAKKTIQAGLDTAEPNGCNVWVQEGTYNPTVAPYAEERGKVIALKSGVALYGGFKGNEIAFNQRDWKNNLTILSGDLDGNDEPGFVNNEENTLHVVSGATGATIDGFTITGGRADGRFSAGFGGGMLNEAASPTVTNCSFTGNWAQSGGGMGNLFSSYPKVTNCSFANNWGSYGGGMRNYDTTSPTVTNCTFSNNSGNYGGGIDNTLNSSPEVTNSILWGNTATTGSQIRNDNSDSKPRLEYDDIQGGCDSIEHANCGYAGTNIDADPKFISDSNLRLQTDSPCIDKGLNGAANTDVDLDGNHREVGVVDMGAYEFRVGCGNYILETGEVCDDGNSIDNDGCSATCQWESNDPGMVQTNPAQSCLEILTADSNALDGIYWLKPTGIATAFQTHCNMTGGGWTLVVNIAGDSADHGGNTDAVGDLKDRSSSAKASDAAINELTTTGYWSYECATLTLYVTNDSSTWSSAFTNGSAWKFDRDTEDPPVYECDQTRDGYVFSSYDTPQTNQANCPDAEHSNFAGSGENGCYYNGWGQSGALWAK